MQFSNFINKLATKASSSKMSSAEAYWSDPSVSAYACGSTTPSNSTPRASISAERPTEKKVKKSAAEAYWSDPVVGAYGFGSTAPSPRPSMSAERRTSSTKSAEQKKAKKVSAAEAYWKDPVLSYGFGPMALPSRI